MKSSLGSAGVSLFIMLSIAAHWAARRTGIAARYAVSFAGIAAGFSANLFIADDVGLADQKQATLQALSRELEIGRSIQQGFLPQSLPPAP